MAQLLGGAATQQTPQNGQNGQGLQSGNVLEYIIGNQGQRAYGVPNYNPQQMNALSQLLQQGLQNYNTEGIENQARQNFNTKTVPSIAERFTAMGSGGQRSSAFASQLGAAGAGLEGQLAQLRSGQGLQQLLLGLQPQTEHAYGEQNSGIQNLLNTLGPELLRAAPQLYSAFKSPVTTDAKGQQQGGQTSLTGSLLSGASGGAGLGSFGGPWGALLGGLLGAGSGLAEHYLNKPKAQA